MIPTNNAGNAKDRGLRCYMKGHFLILRVPPALETCFIHFMITIGFDGYGSYLEKYVAMSGGTIPLDNKM